MADCECLEGCPFFNDKMDKMPTMANIYKKQYCQGNFDSCARHMVFTKLGKSAVPGDLYPNEAARAVSITSSS